MRRVVSCILSFALVVCLSGCSKYSGNYKEVQPLLDYMSDNSQLKISSIDVVWRKDGEFSSYAADVLFYVDVAYSEDRIPLEYLDELRLLTESYLTNNKDFILNDGYTLYFVIRNTHRDLGNQTYAVFSNFEFNNEERLYDKLIYFDSLIYEEDFTYLKDMKDIVQIKVIPTERVENVEYVEGVISSIQNNNEIQSVVLPEQYEEYENEFSDNIEVIFYK